MHDVDAWSVGALTQSILFLPYRSDDLMPLRPRAAERGLVPMR